MNNHCEFCGDYGWLGSSQNGHRYCDGLSCSIMRLVIRKPRKSIAPIARYITRLMLGPLVVGGFVFSVTMVRIVVKITHKFSDYLLAWLS